VPLERALGVILSTLDSLSDAGAVVRAALTTGYPLGLIVLYPTDEITTGCYAGAMADYELDEATLYIACGRLFDDEPTELTLGVGAHNVGRDFKTVLAHELGHLVMPRVEEVIGKKIRIVFDEHPKEYWEAGVSRYAGTDDHEMFAEAFAAWTHAGYAQSEKKLPPSMAEIFEQAGITQGAVELVKARKPRDVLTVDGEVISAATVTEILDAVDDGDWFAIADTLTPAMSQAFEDAGYEEITAAGVSAADAASLFEVVDKGAEKYAEEHSAELISGLEDTTRDSIRGTIEDAITEGWSKPELELELQNNFAFSEARANLIAHTELAMAHSRGRIDVATEAGATGKKWLLSDDHDYEDECNDCADAGVVDMDEDFDDNGNDFPPAHPNACFDGTTYVAYGKTRQLVRAAYSGPAVTLEAEACHDTVDLMPRDAGSVNDSLARCAGVKHQRGFFDLPRRDVARIASPIPSQRIALTIGPNHPVLTRRGFVKAAELREGDQLLYDVRCKLNASLTPSCGRQPNLKKIPFFEDAFKAMHLIFGSTNIAKATHYFHGDEEFIYGEVDAVRPARGLLPVLDPLGIEQLRKCQLTGADTSAAHVASCSTCQAFFERTFSTAVGNMGGSSYLRAFSTFLFGPPKFHCYRVISCHKSSFVGYAFDASTTTGLYNNGGLVVKNCLCDWTASYPGDEESSDEEPDDSEEADSEEADSEEADAEEEDDTEKMAKADDYAEAHNYNNPLGYADDYEAHTPSPEEEAWNEELVVLANLAITSAAREDRDGQRIGGRALAATLSAALGHEVIVDRLNDHRRAYELHAIAAKHYECDYLNSKAAALHAEASALHWMIVGFLDLQWRHTRKLAKEEVGHEFHGNQWTGGTGEKPTSTKETTIKGKVYDLFKSGHEFSYAELSAATGEKESSLKSSISYLKNGLYSDKLVLNIVKDKTTGLMHLEPSKSEGMGKPVGIGKPEVVGKPEAIGKPESVGKPESTGGKISTAEADKVYQGKLNSALEQLKAGSNSAAAIQNFKTAKAEAMAEWKQNTTGVKTDPKLPGDTVYQADKNLQANLKIGMAPTQAHETWKSDTAKEKAGTLGAKPVAAEKPFGPATAKPESVGGPKLAVVEYTPSDAARVGVPKDTVPEGFKQVAVEDFKGPTSAFEKGANELHSSLGKSSGTSEENKAYVQGLLAAQLKDSPNFQALKSANGDTSSTPQQFTLESRLVGSWAGTSGDNNAVSVGMQLAARDLFGMQEKDLSMKALSAIKNAGSEENVMKQAGKSFGKEIDTKIVAAGLQEFVGGMYRATQADLAARGVKDVYVARGMKISGGVHPEIAGVKLQPISSFSTKYSTATGFSGSKGSVFSAKVPASQVLSTYMSGFGCSNEHEVTVLAHVGMQALRLRNSDAHNFHDAATKAYNHLGPKGFSNVTASGI